MGVRAKDGRGRTIKVISQGKGEGGDGGTANYWITIILVKIIDSLRSWCCSSGSGSSGDRVL